MFHRRQGLRSAGRHYLPLLAIVSLSAACGAESHGSPSVLSSPASHIAGFGVHALGSDTDYSLRLSPGSCGVRADVFVHAQGLTREAFFGLSFDPQVYSPASYESAATGEGQVELAVLDQPGRVDYGVVCVPPGDGSSAASFLTEADADGPVLLASFSFEQKPMPSYERLASANAGLPTYRTSSLCEVNWTPGVELSWFYNFRPDYNQDGVVSVHDLSALAPFWGQKVSNFEIPGETPQTTYDCDIRPAVLDSDLNGVIGPGELTAIGAAYGQRCTGFDYYLSNDPGTHYPRLEHDPDSVDPLGFVELGAGTAVAGLLRFTLEFEEDFPSGHFWARPRIDGVPGAPTAMQSFDIQRRDASSGLSYDPASRRLSWVSTMAGDRNGTGFVSLQDITPMGVFRFAQVSTEDPLQPGYLADVFKDGVVDEYDWFSFTNQLGDGISLTRVYNSTDPQSLPVDGRNPVGATAIGLVKGDLFTDDPLQDGIFLRQPASAIWQLTLEEALPSGAYVWLQSEDLSGRLGACSEVVQVP